MLYIIIYILIYIISNFRIKCRIESNARIWIWETITEICLRIFERQLIYNNYFLNSLSLLVIAIVIMRANDIRFVMKLAQKQDIRLLLQYS